MAAIDETVIAMEIDENDTEQELREAGFAWDGKSCFACSVTSTVAGSAAVGDMLDVPDMSQEICTCLQPDTPFLQEEALDVFSFGSNPLLCGDGLESVPGTSEDEPGDTLILKSKVLFLFKYKKAIIDLCDKTLNFPARVEQLLKAWRAAADLVKDSTPEASKNLLYWVLRHTLYLMLGGEWTKLPIEKISEIRSTITNSMGKFNLSSTSVNRCEYILDKLHEPWSDERLISVVNGEPKILTQNDLDCLTAERGCMIVLRLQKLCETKCDMLAFKLCSKTLLALRSVHKNHELRKSISVSHIYFIFDIYLCFVHKYAGVNKFIEEVRRLGIYDAYLLIRRNVNSNSSNTRLMKLRYKVANLAANITIATIMVDHLSANNIHIYCAIMKEWLRMHVKTPIKTFRDIAHKLFHTASSSRHLHLACHIIKEMEMPHWNDLLLELYVRTLTDELNELELLKSEKSCDAKIIMDNEVILSYRYLQIADFLRNLQPHLAHECILTAFSLNPTDTNYKLVKSVAYTKYSMVEEMNSNVPAGGEPSYLPPESNTNELSGMNGENLNTTEIMDETNFACREAIFTEPTHVKHSVETKNDGRPTGETVNFENPIERDISALLSSPRVKFLSWHQSWSDLEINCQRLLQPGGKLEIVRQSLAVANDHLQYLNLDYNQYRNLPEIDGPGIEKGYENYITSDEDLSNNGTNEVSDESNPREKCPSKRQQGQIHKTKSSNNSKHSFMASSSEEGEKRCHPLGEAFANTHGGNLPLSFRQLQENNMKLPFDNNCFKHLLEVSNSNPQDLNLRKLYIQQIQAQFQIAQSYTTALQQQLPMPSSRYDTIDEQAFQSNSKTEQLPECTLKGRIHPMKNPIASLSLSSGAVKQGSILERSTSQEPTLLDSSPVETRNSLEDTSSLELSIATPQNDMHSVSTPTYLSGLGTLNNLIIDRDIDVTKNSMSVTGLQGLLSQFQISSENDSGCGSRQMNVVVGQRKENSSTRESIRKKFCQPAGVHVQKSILTQKDVYELPANAHSSNEHFPDECQSSNLKTGELKRTRNEPSCSILSNPAKSPDTHKHVLPVEAIDEDCNEIECLSPKMDSKNITSVNNGIPVANETLACKAEDTLNTTTELSSASIPNTNPNVRILSCTILKTPLDISKLLLKSNPQRGTSTGSRIILTTSDLLKESLPEVNNILGVGLPLDEPKEHEVNAEVPEVNNERGKELALDGPKENEVNAEVPEVNGIRQEGLLQDNPKEHERNVEADIFDRKMEQMDDSTSNVTNNNEGRLTLPVFKLPSSSTTPPPPPISTPPPILSPQLTTVPKQPLPPVHISAPTSLIPTPPTSVLTSISGATSTSTEPSISASQQPPILSPISTPPGISITDKVIEEYLFPESSDQTVNYETGAYCLENQLNQDLDFAFPPTVGYDVSSTYCYDAENESNPSTTYRTRSTDEQSILSRNDCTDNLITSESHLDTLDISMLEALIDDNVPYESRSPTPVSDTATQSISAGDSSEQTIGTIIDNTNSSLQNCANQSNAHNNIVEQTLQKYLTARKSLNSTPISHQADLRIETAEDESLEFKATSEISSSKSTVEGNSETGTKSESQSVSGEDTSEQTIGTIIDNTNSSPQNLINQFNAHDDNDEQSLQEYLTARKCVNSTPVSHPVDLRIETAEDELLEFKATSEISSSKTIESTVASNSETGTESDESDSERIELNAVKHINNQREGDDDTDSSDSGDLVVLKPSKTFSRLPSAKAQTNTSTKQSSNIQNSSSDQHQENVQQKISSDDRTSSLNNKIIDEQSAQKALSQLTSLLRETNVENEIKNSQYLSSTQLSAPRLQDSKSEQGNVSAQCQDKSVHNVGALPFKSTTKGTKLCFRMVALQLCKNNGKNNNELLAGHGVEIDEKLLKLIGCLWRRSDLTAGKWLTLLTEHCKCEYCVSLIENCDFRGQTISDSYEIRSDAGDVSLSDDTTSDDDYDMNSDDYDIRSDAYDMRSDSNANFHYRDDMGIPEKPIYYRSAMKKQPSTSTYDNDSLPWPRKSKHVTFQLPNCGKVEKPDKQILKHAIHQNGHNHGKSVFFTNRNYSAHEFKKMTNVRVSLIRLSLDNMVQCSRDYGVKIIINPNDLKNVRHRKTALCSCETKKRKPADGDTQNPKKKQRKGLTLAVKQSSSCKTKCSVRNQ